MHCDHTSEQFDAKCIRGYRDSQIQKEGESISFRVEYDLLGWREVPADVSWGVHTLRAVENFPITGIPVSVYPDLIVALACIKQAASVTNRDLNLLDGERADASINACEQLRQGRLFDQFIVDVIQGGAGTRADQPGKR